MNDDKSITGYEKSLIESDAYKLVKSNPAYREACLEVERRLIEAWAATDQEETEKREHIWRKLQVFKDVLAELDYYYVSYMAGSQDVEFTH